MFKTTMASDQAESENKKDFKDFKNSTNNKKRIILTEEDVPGASFKNRNPESCHNEQLKRWLKCRGAAVKGNRTELLSRYVCVYETFSIVIAFSIAHFLILFLTE